MQKSSKRFVISDSGLNSQGFRLLTEGAQLEQFLKNPVLLFNHIRPTGNSNDQILPLGRWCDIQVEGDKITGCPEFDDTDDFAMKIFKKVENGTLNMCSAGAEPLKTSATDYLPGQTHETVTEWSLKEASIVDIGSNPEALAIRLYKSNEGVLELADGKLSDSIPTIQLKDKMEDPKNEKLSEEEKKKLAEQEAEKKLADEEKDKKMKQLMEENEKLKEEVKKMKDGQKDEKVKNLVAQARTDEKITEKQEAKYIRLANADFDGTKELLDSMPKHITLKSQFDGNPAEEEAKLDRLKTLSAKSGKELFREGGFRELKELDVETYKLKYKDYFGVLPKE